MIPSISGSEFTYVSELFNIAPGVVFAGFLALMLWSIVWKGIALWFSARGGQKAWFVALLVINTAGVLEIVYILFFRKRGEN